MDCQRHDELQLMGQLGRLLNILSMHLSMITNTISCSTTVDEKETPINRSETYYKGRYRLIVVYINIPLSSLYSCLYWGITSRNHGINAPITWQDLHVEIQYR
jgi:hypothetical protein